MNALNATYIQPINTDKETPLQLRPSKINCLFAKIRVAKKMSTRQEIHFFSNGFANGNFNKGQN